MRWERLLRGNLRFHGREAMESVVGLVRGDDNYTWSLAPWPYAWVDVYPRTVEDQNLLLELVVPKESTGA